MSTSKLPRVSFARLSRRELIRQLTLSAAALTGSSLLPACTRPMNTSPLPTLAPGRISQATLWTALERRQSTNAFQSTPLPIGVLMQLLWAGFGINRTSSGKRTAPSAMNYQEIDLYVLQANGAFVYDAKGSRLVPVVPEDLRAQAKTSDWAQEAPATILFVADYAKMGSTEQAQKELWSACHTGFIGQNIYLYCASSGLGAHFIATLDRAALSTALKLRKDQSILFAQIVGYPKL